MKSRRLLPALLLLFVGSGCAALIYEVVWFQLLELVIGSSAVSMGVLLGTFMGGMCLGSLLLPRVLSHARASAAGLRLARARHRRDRPPAAVRHAARRRRLHGVGRHRRGRHADARARRGDLPAAADAADGRDAAGHRALGRDLAGRRGLARLLLRRQHRRRGPRQPARRLLPASRATTSSIATYVAVALNVAVASAALADRERRARTRRPPMPMLLRPSRRRSSASSCPSAGRSTSPSGCRV